LNRRLRHGQQWRLSGLTCKDATIPHQRTGETAPYTANRVVAPVRKMFSLAQVWAFIEGRTSPYLPLPQAVVTLLKGLPRYSATLTCSQVEAGKAIWSILPKLGHGFE
jgi:hypothetical protein